jgi:hypothetical protein
MEVAAAQAAEKTNCRPLTASYLVAATKAANNVR